ncbi:DUF3419 family protein [Sphingobium sufflavum]|uniref:DUF3419 family protein n=1 Tax=Sphingobium sufflavum TaxID=1129547 RepID=UPI001F40C457|nr:DUF3419 family protein [Sphingobium sufflavum]MCE7797547.1 DUF3419 family protein [Sphingobium sufflavum]
MSKTRAEAIDRAVINHDGMTKEGLLERAFAFAFRGLVYAQIWEDPVVDMEALAIQPDSHIVTIASGGCNVLSYLVADPERITAVDLNTAHIALNRLKGVAAVHLPDYAHFRHFFGDADRAENIDAYRTHIRPHLDETSRRYWEGRDMVGRRRITMFGKGAYKRGLLGGFIGAAHLVAKLYRIDPRDLLAARDREEQRAIFEERLAPIFDRKFVRWLTDQPASLFGLGIPPAQYDALAGDAKMAAVLRQRLERLACDYDLKSNYFAWQAFGRGYGKGPDAPVPPYLDEANYEIVRARAPRVSVNHANMTDWLATQPDASADRYILLDAQDWMSDAQLTAIWTQISRTARPGARVLFRTAAEPTLLPGRLPGALLDRWHYHAEESLNYTRRDRSSIYGGVHLYSLRG